MAPEAISGHFFLNLPTPNPSKEGNTESKAGLFPSLEGLGVGKSSVLLSNWLYMVTHLVKDTPAPDFTGRDQNGATIRLSDFRGKKLVLYFYPEDNTPGCVEQACHLRDNYEAMLAQDYAVVGVSVDDEASHRAFIEKHHLPFPLLADTDHVIVNAYGVWGEKNMYGKKFMGIHRVTFVIDEAGVIRQIIKRVKRLEHAAQIMGAS